MNAILGVLAQTAEAGQGQAPSSGLGISVAVIIFVLAMFVGLEIITKVPTTLHTPLMSGSNAISGITIVGALLAAGAGGWIGAVFGTLAVAAAMVNVVGGYVVTDRMLAMFKHKKRPKA